jgi:hypothetical protein
MRAVKEAFMWVVVALVILVLMPVVTLDVWLGHRERRRKHFHY